MTSAFAQHSNPIFTPGLGESPSSYQLVECNTPVRFPCRTRTSRLVHCEEMRTTWRHNYPVSILLEDVKANESSSGCAILDKVHPRTQSRAFYIFILVQIHSNHGRSRLTFATRLQSHVRQMIIPRDTGL
jgi:hypothetical protein